MHNIIIDTNVFVSSLIQKSYPFRIVYELLIEDKIQLCISEQLLHEYYDVLHRPKFSKYKDFLVQAETLLTTITLKSKKFIPKIKLDIIFDIKDNRLLELADACSADFLITGNTNDFTFSHYKETKIVTPKEYWDNWCTLS
ncbi:MAG: putative toxin-antitoxin system toxin component, PIN family [Clostridiales bacterium]|jgi:putative PIN family toxin of toxin-antitoxin system|nr:putative toxin-antitoxin system toxin component, PIN family [Clostridiales bacterium]